MYFALKDTSLVLKSGSEYVIINGNSHYKLETDYLVVRNDETVREMALTIGFEEDMIKARELEKSQTGRIRYESILMLGKPNQKKV